jgi:hypothetical protein
MRGTESLRVQQLKPSPVEREELMPGEFLGFALPALRGMSGEPLGYLLLERHVIPIP